jgi:hypothetical protein
LSYSQFVFTLFTIPKAFKGHIGVIQRNAIQSWMRLDRHIEIILFGTDEGTAEAAREFGVRHQPHVERNEFGTILLNSVFTRAQQMARYDQVCYVNCDIMLLEGFPQAIAHVFAVHREFLMVGQRTDVDISTPWRFEHTDWKDELREFAARQGKRRPPNWIDYFAFSRGLYGADLPAFAIGRTCWDDWLVWKALTAKIPVVDVTPEVLAVHQNHDYSHHQQGEAGVWKGVEAGRNAQLAGGWGHLRTIAHATEILGTTGLRPNRRRHWAEAKRRCQAVGRFFFYDVWQPASFAVMNWTRPLRTALGLRTETLRPPTDKA